MTLEEILETDFRNTFCEERKANEYPRYWDSTYVSKTGRKGIWRYKHRDEAGCKPGDGKIVHHKDKNEKNFSVKNLEVTDRAGHCRIEPNARKYDEKSKCKCKGCINKPYAKDLCLKHYMQNRRKHLSK